MIEEYINVHDKFSLEMKVGFTAQQQHKVNDFSVNMWVFIPSSLDINKNTYSKMDFYRDVKSNIRLITPIYLLEDIADPDSLPLKLMRESFEKISVNPSGNISDYEMHIKMFQSILKSSLRNEILRIKKSKSEKERKELISFYASNVARITEEYRKLGQIINIPSVERNVFNYYLFGDEFMSNVIELHTFKLLKSLDEDHDPLYEKCKKLLIDLINNEINYKRTVGYPLIEKESFSKNRDVVSRFSALKKYIESQLFLDVKTREDGTLVRQFYYSLAAGISMIFATIIAFSFQLKYGNFTLPLFIALVVGYMLKDRIKELFRYYFSHKLDSKYFDNKITVSINDILIGWCKESQSFVKDFQIPLKVKQLRDRSAILEAENRINDEKIILYKLRMQLDRKQINESNMYPVAGVNNILRFNVVHFIQKMDNPSVPLYVTDEKTDYKVIEGEKIYYLNFILQYQYLDQSELKKYRVAFNRDGIKNLERF